MSRTKGSRAKYKAKRKEKRAAQRAAGQSNKNAKPQSSAPKKKRHQHARKVLSDKTVKSIASTAAAMPPSPVPANSDAGDEQPPTSPVPASPNEAVADAAPAPEAAATA